jgi:1-acyl-sn-glycerol-3-phosphate acyltransferase
VSELFYKSIRLLGRAVFRVASRPLILHPERAARSGAFLLAANHESPFDAALLIAATPRVIYWLSIVELFRHPFTRWFLSSMLAAPLDRSRTDTATVRLITRHLRAGRVVGLFPEGGLRTGGDSVLAGGSLKDGVARIAELARVSVLPCVVLGGKKFHRWANWLPLFRTRWAVAFGEPIDLPRGGDRVAFTQALEHALRCLRDEIQAHV